MFSLKITLLLAACMVLTVAAIPVEIENFYESQPENIDEFAYEPVLSRQVRSPEGGSIDLGYKKDQFGREASVNYNHNLFTSKDGRGTVDAYAQGSRNFDHNRNDYGGGIRGSWGF